MRYPTARVARLLLPWFGALACAAAREDTAPAGDASGLGGDGTSDLDGGDGSATDDDPDDDAGDDGGNDPKFDTQNSGGGSAAEGGVAPGCKKVDFLFVVDNSGSMADEQQNLTASFAGFVSAITDIAEVDDFHILVTDTDGALLADFPCGGLPACCDAACNAGVVATCDGNPCPGDPCSFTGGAGRTTAADGSECGVAGAQHYLVSDQPDLAGTFACVAEVGTMGNGDERQAEAVTLAVGPELNGPDGCNAGFVRDDALLVITLISDEEDAPNDGADMDPNSPGDPAAWVDAIVTAKQGAEAAVVFLALVGDNDLPGAMCGPIDPDSGTGAEPAPRLRELANAFTYGSTGSVCAPDYGPFFADAVSVIDSACDEYVPPG